MAYDSDSRTEAPTPRRRNEARGKGQVARSADLPAAVVLLVALISLDLFGLRIWERLKFIIERSCDFEGVPQGSSLMHLAGTTLLSALLATLPIVLLVLISILLTQYAQVGWLITFHPLEPNLNKLNPVNGFQRLFSGRAIAVAAINLAKLALVSGVTYWTLRDRTSDILFAASLSLWDMFSAGIAIVFQLGLRLAILLVLLAIIDYAYQRYRHERDLRMTKEEVKDEMRSMEGAPEIRRRRRQLQQKFSLQRIRNAVPQADVVVTNPTHLAIAIRYDADSMAAPKVIAKGADMLAARIRQIALSHGVPIVQRPDLARAMYEVEEIGEYVPERFYQAIAEILAYVYELSGRFPRWARTAQPA